MACDQQTTEEYIEERTRQFEDDVFNLIKEFMLDTEFNDGNVSCYITKTLSSKANAWLIRADIRINVNE